MNTRIAILSMLTALIFSCTSRKGQELSEDLDFVIDPEIITNGEDQDYAWLNIGTAPFYSDDRTHDGWKKEVAYSAFLIQEPKRSKEKILLQETLTTRMVLCHPPGGVKGFLHILRIGGCWWMQTAGNPGSPQFGWTENSPVTYRWNLMPMWLPQKSWPITLISSFYMLIRRVKISGKQKESARTGITRGTMS